MSKDPIAPLSRIPVSDLRDITEYGKKEVAERVAIRNQSGAGVCDADAVEALGGNPWDGDMTAKEQKEFITKVRENGFMATFSALAKQGSEAIGASMLWRQDPTYWTEGSINSAAVISGTAKMQDGVKISGDGANIKVQIEYQVSAREMEKVAQEAAEDVNSKRPVIIADVDANGATKLPKIRANMEFVAKENGIFDLRVSLNVDNIPAAHIPSLIKLVEDDEIEIPLRPLIRIARKENLGVNFQINGHDGANFGFRSTVKVLEDEFEDAIIPDAVVAANLDMDIEFRDQIRAFINPRSIDIALETPFQISWGEDDNKVHVKYENVKGKTVEYPVGEAFPGTDSMNNEDMVDMILSSIIGNLE